MSLARGLDYYTGVIYEAILLQQPESVMKNEKGLYETAFLEKSLAMMKFCR